MTTQPKLPLFLSSSHRDLLLKYQSQLTDKEVRKEVTTAHKNNNQYELNLTEEQVDDLYDNICSIANIEKDLKLQSELDELSDYFEEKYMDLGGDNNDMEIYEDDVGNDEESRHLRDAGPVFILKVVLEGNTKIWRKIAIRGGQTLHDLHDIIYDAFDREEEHLYSFYIPNPFIDSKSRKKTLASAIEYTHSFNLDDSPVSDRGPENAEITSMMSLGLVNKQKLFYLFDFGDEWWHEITVEKIGGVADADDYPRILEKMGDSPAQYEGEEEEEE